MNVARKFGETLQGSSAPSEFLARSARSGEKVAGRQFFVEAVVDYKHKLLTLGESERDLQTAGRNQPAGAAQGGGTRNPQGISPTFGREMEPLHGSRALGDPDARGVDAGAESDLCTHACTGGAVPLPDDGSEALTPAQMSWGETTPRDRSVRGSLGTSLSPCTHPHVPAAGGGFSPEMYAAAGVLQTARARVLSVAEREPTVLQDTSPEIQVFNFSPEMSNFAVLSEISVFLVFCIFILIILFI